MEEVNVNTNEANESTPNEEGNQTQENVETKPLTKKDLLRELSKEHGVNLFDVEGLKQFKEYTENQKTESQKLNEELELYKTKESEWNSKVLEYESKLKASELGISSDKLEDALKLAEGNPDNLAKVLEKYPIFKSSSEVVVGVTQPNTNNAPSGDTEVEAYLEANYKNNPYYKKQK